MVAGFLKSMFGGKPKPISITAFRDAFIARLRTADPTARTEIVNDSTITIERGDLTGSVFVENVYAGYVRDPAQLDFHLDKLLRLVANTSPDAPQGVNQLVLVARHVDYGRSVGAEVLMRPLAGDVGLLLAFDTPTALAGALESSVAEQGLSSDEAFARAVENLPDRVGDLDVQKFEHANVFHITSDSGLATGLLALPDLWRNGVPDCAIFVVTRKAFLWCDLADGQAVDALRQFAKVVKVPDPVSKTLLALENGVWRDLGQ